MKEREELLRVEHLKQHFRLPGKKEVVHAVEDVSFHIWKGETFGLVGESGCGKSTVARDIIRLYEPTDGKIVLDGQDITHRKEKELKEARRKMQMVFQDPYSSLNSRMTIRDILEEPLIASRQKLSKAEMEQKCLDALRMVHLDPDFIHRYPHEFSGGQRQRICIARALIVNPEFLICDEAISALDVSIQAQIINMLSDFQKEYGLTYLFIAHDLSMVRYVSHRVGVMYLGHLMEVCESEEIYRNPLHPYTKGLLSSIPIANPRIAREHTGAALEGEVPSPVRPPSGCPFHTRCPYAKEKCSTELPVMREVEPEHYVKCHFC